MSKKEDHNKRHHHKKASLKNGKTASKEKTPNEKTDDHKKKGFKLKRKLSEHTAFKNVNKNKKPNRQAVWVKKATLEYEQELHRLQIELLKMQKYVKSEGLRIVMLFEGRDAAGKGGTIKRIIEHMNPRGTRVVALMTPSDTERTQWYFQRYIQHMPSAGEIVLFDRSWYNRAMVEPVMDFCTDEQNKRFLKDVPMVEEMLVKDGVIFLKYFFSVSKEE